MQVFGVIVKFCNFICVLGQVSYPSLNHLSMFSLSYVSPDAIITGSRISFIDIGQQNSGGGMAAPDEFF
uniref:Uncharacterized protein n=1 Tax=Arundo donax TaxID=35708 RepID=A0A0A9DE43_ARUDO